MKEARELAQKEQQRLKEEQEKVKKEKAKLEAELQLNLKLVGDRWSNQPVEDDGGSTTTTNWWGWGNWSTILGKGWKNTSVTSG